MNPVTNKIYVANCSSNNVTVIDGATNATTTVAAGSSPYSVAVNPVTNKIYVANYDSDNVTVIDGATNATTTVAAGTTPFSVAVNPVTNKIYVANYGSDNVTVIDGATNATTTVAAGTSPFSVAVNPVTNKIYVANYGSDNVTVIDGATNATTTVAAGTSPYSVAVNPVTNKIYVANNGSGNVTVIDGATNATTTVAAGTVPCSVAVNPVTNKIYVANYGSDNVTVIDGATNATTTVAAGTSPRSVAVNPVTNKIYVANYSSDNVTALTEQAVSAIPLTTTISPLAGDVTYSATPTFTLSAASAFAPTAPPVQGVFTQVDTWQGPWQAATPSAGVFTATTSTLGLGTHVLYAYAVDGQEGTGCSNGDGSTCSPLVGSIAAYVFTVVPPQADVSITKTDGATSGGAWHLRDLHDRRQQRRSLECAERDGGGHVPGASARGRPGPAREREAGPARRRGSGNISDTASLPVGRLRDLHGHLHHLGLGDRHPEQHRHGERWRGRDRPDASQQQRHGHGHPHAPGRCLDHEDGRRHQRGARHPRDLHDRRQQRRSLERAERDGGGHVPGASARGPPGPAREREAGPARQLDPATSATRQACQPAAPRRTRPPAPSRPAATGTLTNTATATVGGGVTDPTPGNNSATDTDTLTPLTVSIGDAAAVEGNAGTTPATFTVTLSATSSQTVAVHYATLDGEATAPADYTTASGDLTFDPGVISQSLVVPVEGDLLNEIAEHFTVQLSSAVNVLIDQGVGTGTIVDDDPNRELTHGADAWQSLAAQAGVARTDYYRVAQQPYSSYEVVVEGGSGDVQPVQLERLGADNTTVLPPASGAIGSGAARSLRWRNASSSTVTTHALRVRSGGSCGTDCGADDVYRIRFYETTCSIPRFNNSSSQQAAVILHNPADYTIAGTVYFWNGTGTLLASADFTLAGKQIYLLSTSSLAALSGQSGTITIAHDGRYGDLAGKAVALEPATGYSFDSPMVWRSLR